MKLNYQSPNNSKEYEEFTCGEASAQPFMDLEYQNQLGWKIKDRKGTINCDLKVEIHGVERKVEEKYRTGDYNDLLVEIEQDLVERKPGWFYTTTADLLSYIICRVETDGSWTPWKYIIINWASFHSWFYFYCEREKHIDAKVSSKGKGLTLNLAIPWSHIDGNIYQAYLVKTELTPFRDENDQQFSFLWDAQDAERRGMLD